MTNTRLIYRAWLRTEKPLLYKTLDGDKQPITKQVAFLGLPRMQGSSRVCAGVGVGL